MKVAIATSATLRIRCGDTGSQWLRQRRHTYDKLLRKPLITPQPRKPDLNLQKLGYLLGSIDRLRELNIGWYLRC